MSERAPTALRPAARAADPRQPAHAMERFWRLVTRSLVFVGFASLAFTGELHPALMLAFVVVWTAAMVVHATPGWWRPWMAHAITWLVSGAVAVLAILGQFDSLLYLLLFLGAYRCFHLQQPTDHMQALLVALFMFLATSVITNSISYLLFLAVFVVLATLALVCFALGREQLRALSPTFPAGADHPGAHVAQQPRRGSLIRISALIGGFTIFLAFPLFFLMPHYRSGNFSNPWSLERQQDEQARLTGYTDDISLQPFSRIEQDLTKVMSVRVRWSDEGPYPLPNHLYMRGTSLDQYDETHWTTGEPSIIRRSRDWRIVNMAARGPGFDLPMLVADVEQRVDLTGRLMGPSMPRRFLVAPKFPYSFELDWRNSGLHLRRRSTARRYDLETGDYRYRVWSDLALYAPSLLRRIVNGETYKWEAPAEDLVMRAEDRRTFTQLPDSRLTDRIREMYGGAIRPEFVPQRLLELLTWFRGSFEYSFTPDTPRGMHPIEAFLMRTRQGHCEYFATSMVLILRAQGIPSRVVTGFYASEAADLTERVRVFTVRQSDAHAWVECWLDGYGWLTLDPTPPDVRGRASFAAHQPSWTQRTQDQVQSVWRRYILDYSSSMQGRLFGGDIWIRPMYGLSRMGYRISRAVERLRAGAPTTELLPLLGNTRWLGGLLAAIGAVGFLLVLLVQRRNGPRRAARALRRSPVRFMNRLLKLLERGGLRRAPGQTPAEVVARLRARRAGDGLEGELDWMIDLYQKCRFGGHRASPAEIKRVGEVLRKLKQGALDASGG